MTYAEYAQSHGLLSAGAGRAHAEELQQTCLALYNEVESNATATPDDWRNLDRTCNQIEAYIVKQSGGVNVYDVRSFVQNYDFAPLTNYLGKSSVRHALHVDKRANAWKDGDDTVAYILEAQEQKSSAPLMPAILAQIRVLVYSGVFDMDCNFLSTDAWLSALDWPNKAAYHAAQMAPWRPAGKVWGHGLEVGNLTQRLILGAGHLVPMNQGRSALAMLEEFIHEHPLSALDGSAAALAVSDVAGEPVLDTSVHTGSVLVV